jgi:hypothetical protein
MACVVTAPVPRYGAAAGVDPAVSGAAELVDEQGDDGVGIDDVERAVGPVPLPHQLAGHIGGRRLRRAHPRRENDGDRHVTGRLGGQCVEVAADVATTAVELALHREGLPPGQGHRAGLGDRHHRVSVRRFGVRRDTGRRQRGDQLVLGDRGGLLAGSEGLHARRSSLGLVVVVLGR